MTVGLAVGKRAAALERAQEHAPFLRAAVEAFPNIAQTFLDEGSDVAVTSALLIDGETAAERLRRRRHAMALATALADLSGEKGLEWVTATLSDFADAAMDEALRTAMLERLPDEEPRGLSILALGKLGSRELNYSSDVDLILLFDPETLPRRPRDEPGEAAVRYGRRFIELMQQRTRDGYVARVDMRLRPSPEVTPIGQRSFGRGQRPATWGWAAPSYRKYGHSSGAARSISARSRKSATSPCGFAITTPRARRSGRALT